MTADDPNFWRYLTATPWLIFLAYWVISSFRTRQTAGKESAASRSSFLLFEIPGYILLFSERARIGVWGQPMFHQTLAIAVTGVAFTWLGLALAIWARWHIGEYWSARVTIKEDHKLIRSGPYARLRHPIYSGLDLAAIGMALLVDEWGCLVGLALIVVGYVLKAKKEERMLAAQFGEVFQEHCRHTGFLFPKLG